MLQNKDAHPGLARLVVAKILATYFTDELKCRFHVGGALLNPHEVFCAEGMVVLFAPLADLRSRAMFEQPMVDAIVDEAASMLGKRVIWTSHLNSLQIPVLMQAAEEVFDIDCRIDTPRDIDLEPVVHYFNLTPEQRSRVKCPWKPLKLLS